MRFVPVVVPVALSGSAVEVKLEGDTTLSVTFINGTPTGEEKVNR